MRTLPCTDGTSRWLAGWLISSVLAAVEISRQMRTLSLSHVEIIQRLRAVEIIRRSALALASHEAGVACLWLPDPDRIGWC